MISHQHQCIFVEIPKTGSTSIRAILGSPPKAHLNICQIRDEMRQYWTRYVGIGNRVLASLYLLRSDAYRCRRGQEQFDAYFKFGFVRNPWDRVVSLYHRKQGVQMHEHMSFAEFVDWIRYSSSTCVHPVPHTNQLDWLVDPNGNLLVDFVGRFERLHDDWRTIAGELALPQSLPHRNRNPAERRHYTEYYSERTRDVIGRKFRVDIDYFGYRFGD